LSSKNSTSKSGKKKTSKNNRTIKGSSGNSTRLKNEVKGIIYIVVAVLFLISKQYEDGLIFGYLINVLKFLSGKGYILVPYFLIIIGVLYFSNFIKERKNVSTKYIVIIFISILSILTIIDKSIVELNIYENKSLVETIKYFSEMNYSSTTLGGGIIGGIFSYLLVFLFGRIGSLIICGAVITISFILLSNRSMMATSNKFIKTLYNGAAKILKTIKDFVFVEEKVKTSKKQDKKEEILYKDYSYKTEMNKQKLIDLDIESENKKNIFNENNSLLETKNVSLKLSNENIYKGNLDKKDKEKEITEKENQEHENIKKPILVNNEGYKLPSIDLLNININKNQINEKKEAIESADILLRTLNDFGIDCKLVQINRGPTITRYELQPAPGVKVNKILNLSKDIALSLAKSDLRIEAPIPGKAAVGIEVPNNEKSNVFLRELFESSEYKKEDVSIPFVVGKDIAGKNIVADITAMPHLLIAGATGSGKSVCINSLLMSILYKSKPNEVKLILVDPKVVELNVYNGIPHLLIPVVTDPRKAANALNWAVQEMTNRYEIFAKNSVRDINSYNSKKRAENPEEVIPKIVVIIDELADLMLVAAGEVEDSITRLAQLARAAGIHLVIATQRPSVDVITGTIKANIPSRIAFAVSSYIDSRTILDMSGAEKLLGKGDLLYHPVGISKPIRIQGAFVSDDEVKRVIEFINAQGHDINTNEKEEEIINIQLDKDSDYDDLLQRAAELVVIEGQASVSYMQRKLKVGYSRAARIIDQLEELGIVGPHEGSKPRKVLIDAEELEEIVF
jgi:S-DNA-T family DNA segregation ATPase FtsK/SpoIIIE